MSIALCGWLVLAFPLAGMLVTSLGWRRLPGRAPGWLREPAVESPVERAGGATRPAYGTAEGPGDPAPHGGSA